MNFEFLTSPRIIFGSRRIQNLGSIAKTQGNMAILVKGSGSVDVSTIEQSLSENGLKWIEFKINKEPDVEFVNRGIELARNSNCDFVIGIGGGSVIDAGKAISAMLSNDGSLTDYLEVIGLGKKIKKRALPYIAVPTTSGTGSEVTKNAVVKDIVHNVKVSLRSDLIIPSVALIDPELTWSVPPGITASTGMDAFTQVLEPYVSKKANSFTDMICEAGIKTGARALSIAYSDGNNRAAREKMSYMSLMGGLALANAGLGAVHGFAGPIGGMFDIPHGQICACLLPYVIQVNINAMLDREPQNNALVKYRNISRIVTQHESETEMDIIDWIFNTCQELNIPRLSEVGIFENDFDSIVEKSKNSSSMKGNPILLTNEELYEILQRAF